MNNDEITVYPSLEGLNSQDRELIDAAIQALPLSYAPYSQFHVACAIRIDNGSIITGVNQENASFPAGRCAEDVALNRKGAEYPDAIITGLAVVASRLHSETLAPAAPCGICRQVMLEFVSRQGQSFAVLMTGENDSWIKVHSMESLLPFGFTSKSL